MDSINKGRKLITGFIITILVLDILISLLLMVIYGFQGMLSVGIARFAGGIIRFILTGAIFYCLYKGQIWAKWLNIILMLLGGIFGILVCILNFSLLTLLPSLLFAIFGVLLITSKDINNFLRFQKHGKNLDLIENGNN